MVYGSAGGVVPAAGDAGKPAGSIGSFAAGPRRVPPHPHGARSSLTLEPYALTVAGAVSFNTIAPPASMQP